MGLFSIAPWQRKQKTEPEAKGAEKFPSPSDDQRADDYFAGGKICATRSWTH